MILKSLVFFFVFILTLTTFSQIPDDIEIEGDEIFYTKNKQILNVSGNVKLKYESYEVEAEQFYYDLENNIIRFPKSFVFKQKNESIYGSNMFYDGQNMNGSAEQINANLYDVTVKGDRLIIKKDKFTLENTYCTSCKGDKGYYITSKSIEMYYLLGILIAKNSKVALDFFPLKLPVPFFIYGDSQLGLMEETNVFPELGSTKSEGAYIKQRLSYILNPKLAGSVQFSSTRELGSFFGGNTRYLFDEDFVLNLNYFYGFHEDNFRGKFHLSYLFSNSMNSSTGLFSSLENSFFNSKSRIVKFDFLYQYKLLINDEFVNYSPLFKLKIDQMKLSNMFVCDLDFSIGTVGEFQDNDVLTLGRLKYHNNLTFSYLLTSFITFNAVTFLDVNLYEDGTSWRRGFQSFGMTRKGILNPSVSYNKRLFYAGQSPFNHEINYALVSDEVAFSFSQKLKHYVIQSHHYFSISKQQFRDSIWEFDMLFDCWKIGVGWKLANEQFYFRFELL
tara:strand:+ start:178 stop:1683 length:1506 start_codon:yes stop_codon:yes gene_type:complete